MRLNDLKDIHLDALKEVANIGSGHAATALSQLIGKTVYVQVPEVKILKIEDIPGLIPEDNPIVVGILTNFFGDATGKNLLIIPKNEAELLVDILLSRTPGTTKIFQEMEISSLKEVANIVTSSYLGAMGEFLGFLLIPSVPSLTVDELTSIITTVYVEFTEEKEYAFCVETAFYFAEEDKKLHGYLIMIPDPEALENMLKAMNLL